MFTQTYAPGTYYPMMETGYVRGPTRETTTTTLTTVQPIEPQMPTTRITEYAPIQEIMEESRQAPRPSPRSITTGSFRKVFADNRKFYMSSSEIKKIQEDDRRQAEEERQMVLKATPCALTNPASLHGKAPYIDTGKLGELIRGQFYDQSVMEAAVCALDSIVFIPGERDPQGGLLPAERVRMWITKVRQIGTESVEGYAMLGSLGAVDDIFIMKAPRDPAGSSLNHEVVVGMYGLNGLRKFVPNFSYVYGFISCSPPVISLDDKKALSYCLGDNKTTYVIYENISGAVSFGDFVKTCSAQEFKEVYLQALLALREAVERVGFTHYDLHKDNLLVQKGFKLNRPRFADVEVPERKLIQPLPTTVLEEKSTSITLPEEGKVIIPLPQGSTLESLSSSGDTATVETERVLTTIPRGFSTIPYSSLAPSSTGGFDNNGETSTFIPSEKRTRTLPEGQFQIPYRTSGGLVYLATKNLARFIDYGFSRIEYNGKSYGKAGFEAYSIFRDRAFPLNDAYRLLMMSGPLMNPQVFAEAEKIFRFFNRDEKMSDCLRSQREYYYSLPYYDVTASMTLDDLITYIFRELDVSSFISTQKGDLVMECGSECQTLTETLTKVRAFSDVVPYDITSYYDAIERAKDDSKTYDSLVQGFRNKYEGANTAFQKKIREMIADINNQMSVTSLIDMSRFDFGQMMNEVSMGLYQNMLTRYITLKDSVETLKTYRKIGLVAAQSYGSSNNENIVWYRDRLTANIKLYESALSQSEGVIARDDQVIDAYVADPRFKELAGTKLGWYKDKRDFYRIAIRR